MKTTPVQSSNLREVGYDPARREMRVVFHSGAVHDHLDVPPEEYAGLMSAPSHGKHYNARIKDIYTSRKMGGMLPQQDDPGADEAERYPRAERGLPENPRSLDEAIARFRGDG